MDKDAVREAIAHAIAPLLIRCAEMRVQLDLTEDALPISLDKRTRDACRVRLMMRRAELEAVIAALQGNELIEKVMRLAKEKWPSWRLAASSSRSQSQSAGWQSARSLAFCFSKLQGNDFVEGDHGEHKVHTDP